MSTEKKIVRTRFAPSPTGSIHVGGIRTALFAFLLARQNGGKFILRLEDTDKKREVAGSDAHIVKSLLALGIEYDEGPTTDEQGKVTREIGDFGPYKQSERLSIYHDFARQLAEKGRAYVDPYTPAEIQAFRDEAQAAKRAFRFRDHRPETPDFNCQPGKTLRFLSEPKDAAWHDEVMGNLAAPADAMDDLILIKSDGFPTYNFAHIIDDLTMEITHIIRGQEFVSSMPNYLNLYEALDILPPAFAHMPHILNETGNKKLGKRDGAKDVLDYFRDGFLQEALVNFIASMGWNDGTEQEVFSLEELIDKFSLSRVQKSGARFDEKRLLWLNGQWVRRLSLSELYERTTGERQSAQASARLTRDGEFVSDEPRDDAREERRRSFVGTDAGKADSFWGEHGQKSTDAARQKVLAVVQERLKTLADLPSLTEYFFARPTPDWSMIDDNKQLKKVARDDLLKLLATTHKKLSELSDNDFANLDTLQQTLNDLLAETEQKPAILFSIIRFALTWAPFSPALPETMSLLGRDETLARLQA